MRIRLASFYFFLLCPTLLGQTRDDVPLRLWIHPDWPNGLEMKGTNGVSFGDYDNDGWVDLFVCQSGNLWRNLGGKTWYLADNLKNTMPDATWRYGASFADFNNDRRLDLAIEPRLRANEGDDCFHLLRQSADGTRRFVDIADNPLLVDEQPCSMSAETICWGDLDGDGYIEVFVPAYPDTSNYKLYHNLGPTGPNGAYRFRQCAEEVGLEPDEFDPFPEGAQCLDVDEDGDLDLYTGGHIFRNRTEATLAFESMKRSSTKIPKSFDEGCLFFDYDLDGDYDFLGVYVGRAITLCESNGDGTFRIIRGAIEEPAEGRGLGASAEDWDNDGDIDITTRHVFRRNLFMEEGRREFVIATHSIPQDHLSKATPAWADWDRDGDLDCALGNYSRHGHFYENTLYDLNMPSQRRRVVRIRILRDDPTNPSLPGIPNEFGASAEIVVHGEEIRRRKFTASSHGYLNQNEYELHFPLPADPSPNDPANDIVFDIVVDFPTNATRGRWRVDKHVNDVLGNIRWNDLHSPVLSIYRSGRVTFNDRDFPPNGDTPRLWTTNGGLILATVDETLPDHEDAPSKDHFVGMAFETGSKPLRVREIVMDAQLGQPLSCHHRETSRGQGVGCPDGFNIALWDATNPGAPVLTWTSCARTSVRNNRSYLRTDVSLEANRHYRLVAHVDARRFTPINAPVHHEWITVHGGLEYKDSNPCHGQGAVGVEPNPDRVAMALRVGPR